VLRVRDEGSGIAAELLPPGLRLFVQGERRSSAPAAGWASG
jgi:hypothetical protein